MSPHRRTVGRKAKVIGGLAAGSADVTVRPSSFRTPPRRREPPAAQFSRQSDASTTQVFDIAAASKATGVKEFSVGKLRDFATSKNPAWLSMR
ncbi:hypothetical protein [Wenjunlia tyrosinilytica]|uniref:Uncharacterized protein n=1 Tax=Wenjunlia tyrosinilytica TaxID=1544741 RepID=A0A917ZYQ2_9ACTN|nr:hypothetical protein [Wenjunlia tyrosinilytica]GGP00589.1 hypothetical protein GCM10012280_69680 [Wenjunlia tyrosinilytica]